MRMVACLLVTAFLAVEAHAEYRFFDSDGVRIRYIEQGVGEPIVLLHGHTSRIELNWITTGVFDALSASHRVIAMDFRGYGESGKPHDPSAYGSEMADDVIRLLDHLSIDRAHIIGYSMGARMTSWLVVHRPERLLSAVLGASTYAVDSPEQARAYEAIAVAWESDDPLDAEAFKRGNPGIGDAEAAESVASRTAINDPRAITAVFRSRADTFISEDALSTTEVPILHIYGSLEAPGRLRAAERLKTQVLPSVESVVMEGATHSGHTALYRHPDFVETIESFIARHRDKR